MPSPRAVLNDISNLGLNPNKKYSSLGKSGSLKSVNQATTVLEKKELKKKVKQLVEEVVQAVDDSEQSFKEEVVQAVDASEQSFKEEIAESTLKSASHPQAVVTEKKKGKFAKKKSNND